MKKKKIVLALMTFALIGGLVGGCGKNASDNKSDGKEEQSQSGGSGIPAPEGEKMDDELMEEFMKANELSALCEKYGNVQIDSSYVYMDENGKKSSGGKDSTVYALGEAGLVNGSQGSDYWYYSEGDQLMYSSNSYEGSSVNSVTYFSESMRQDLGMSEQYGLYAGSEYVENYGYKETKDGYEIYEVYDWGDGTGNVITYYADKDKVVTKSESVCYPENAARYVDSERKLVLGVDAVPQMPESFVNGEITVTVIEKNSGNQTEIKVPAGTEIYFMVSEVEAATLDEAGTQFLGENRYDSYAVVNENMTVYIVEIGADTGIEENGLEGLDEGGLEGISE